MSHLVDDTLAAIAVGDASPAAAAAHLDVCPDCMRRLESFTRLVGTLSHTTEAATLDAPPPRIWQAISRAIASDDAEPAPSMHAGPPHAASAPVSLDQARQARRRPTAWTIAAVAASGLVVGAAGVGLLGTITSDEASATLASTTLEDLNVGGEVGSAKVEERADGSTVLVVDVAYAEPADGSFEVWLIDTDVKGMISVGYLTSPHGEFVIPDGFDVAAHPIVDISVEPHDGVPTHSGVSVTRGVLDL